MEVKVKRTKASSMKNRQMEPPKKSSVWTTRRVAPRLGADFRDDPNFVNHPDFVDSDGYDGDEESLLQSKRLKMA